MYYLYPTVDIYVSYNILSHIINYIYVYIEIQLRLIIINCVYNIIFSISIIYTMKIGVN